MLWQGRLPIMPRSIITKTTKLEVAHDTYEVHKEMRKKVFYSIAITTLLLVFSACSGNDDDGKKGGNVSKCIIGTWAVKNMSCLESGKQGADILTYTTNNRMETKHYEDKTGYGIFKYDDTYTGSWSVDRDRLWMKMPVQWIGPNNLKIVDIQEDIISFSPWGNEGAYATMEKYAKPENSIYGYWELTKCTGTLTKENGKVLDINDGSFTFHYLYFSKTALQNHNGYNGVILDDREKSPQLMNFDFDGSKIVIYKVDNGKFLDGDFTVKSISDDHIILHFYGHDAPTEIFDIDMYLNRIPTFLNQ